jgi:hypothetical protein
VALGLFGERWVRSWGDVRCNIDSWHDVTDTGRSVTEDREVEVTFLNEKDLNAVVWNIQVVFHKEGDEPFCPTLTFSDEPGRGGLVGVLNLPPWIAVTRRMMVALYTPTTCRGLRRRTGRSSWRPSSGSGRSERSCVPPGTDACL